MWILGFFGFFFLNLGKNPSEQNVHHTARQVHNTLSKQLAGRSSSKCCRKGDYIRLVVSHSCWKEGAGTFLLTASALLTARSPVLFASSVPFSSWGNVEQIGGVHLCPLPPYSSGLVPPPTYTLKSRQREGPSLASLNRDIHWSKGHHKHLDPCFVTVNAFCSPVSRMWEDWYPHKVLMWLLLGEYMYFLK